ncbi:MAG: hypothetical protein AAGD06_19135 [Acidobacteriota bacterium]
MLREDLALAREHHGSGSDVERWLRKRLEELDGSTPATPPG